MLCCAMPVTYNHSGLPMELLARGRSSPINVNVLSSQPSSRPPLGLLHCLVATSMRIDASSESLWTCARCPPRFYCGGTSITRNTLMVDHGGVAPHSLASLSPGCIPSSTILSLASQSWRAVANFRWPGIRREGKQAVQQQRPRPHSNRPQHVARYYPRG